MAHLVNIWIDTVYNGERCRHALRLDWDNDRHQSIHLNSLEPGDIVAGLGNASIELNKEMRREKI